MTADPLFPPVVAVRALIGCNSIDGGDTVDVRFTAADGRTIAVLIPWGVFAELQAAEVPAPRSPEDRLGE